MTNDTLKIDIADWADKPLGEIETHIRGLNKRRLGDLKFLDLLVSPDGKRGMRHGVYLFFDEKNKCRCECKNECICKCRNGCKCQCLYVGKCSSSHFAQRLGMHFGMSPSYGGNFLGRAVEKLLEKKSYENYAKAVGMIGDYRYLMIVVNPNSNLYEGNEHKIKVVNKLERIFMAVFDPELNKFGNFNHKKLKSKLDKSPDKSLRVWIEELVRKPAPAKQSQ